MKRLVLIGCGAAMLLSACGTGTSTSSSGRACTALGSEHPVTVLITDVSGSTRDLRAPQGEFEQDWMLAACHTALHQGTLWATTADSQTVANSVWQVRGTDFKPTIDGNDLLAAAEMNKKANALAPEAREIVGVTKPSQSDLLGALQVSSRLFRDYPERSRALVFL